MTTGSLGCNHALADASRVPGNFFPFFYLKLTPSLLPIVYKQTRLAEQAMPDTTRPPLNKDFLITNISEPHNMNFMADS